MNEPAPGFLRTPTPAASALVAISVLTLPAGSRDRYRDEFRAELVILPAGRQITVAASVLAGSVNLRHALQVRDGSDPLAGGRRWVCRLGKHQYVLVNDDNPENRRNMHKECILCDKVKDTKDYQPTDGRWMGRQG